MDIRSALALGHGQLASSPNPRLDARLLLAHVLGQSHAYLVAHGEEELSESQQRDYLKLLDEAAAQMPIPYLTGEAHFYRRAFHVTPAVLIPRPETEELVQLAANWLRHHPGANVVDVGSGSGCIAVTLACECPGIQMTATDVSAEALAVARQNARRHHVNQHILFLTGHLLKPVTGPIDLLLANLPYVSDEEWAQLPPSVRDHEPALALRGGEDGLKLLAELLLEAASRMQPGGVIMLEIGWRQGPAARQLAQQAFPLALVSLRQDLAGQDRFITIQT